ncbi:MAG: hypothetical protein P1V97_04900 [Planctomycetota bacterium]|nr:hypothetical protein [Planctomycetota bacterium]
MSLPRKKSRLIRVSGESYRWMVSGKGGRLRLIIDAEKERGQKLFVQLPYFELFVRNAHGFWMPTKQVQSLGSGRVRHFIELGLEQGWQPSVTAPRAFYLQEPNYDFPEPPIDRDFGMGVYAKEAASHFLSDLRFDLAMGGVFVDLRAVSVGGSVPLPDQVDQPEGLGFSIIREDFAECGCFNIRIQCDDFPSISIQDLMYYPENCVRAQSY